MSVAGAATRWPRVAALRTPAALRARLEELGWPLPCDDAPLAAPDSPLARPLALGEMNGRAQTAANRFVVQPMEGWDGTPDGRPTALTERRWRNFGRSGAGLVWGCEAVAVVEEGRANPHQLVLSPATAPDLARLRAALAAPVDDQLVLIGRRDLRSNNSWMHNSARLVKGPARCTLKIHPTDAAARGLTDGALAQIASPVGAVVAPVEVTDELAPGVVSLPHGYGHQLEGVRLSVAQKKQPGACSNYLTDELALDVPSGTHVANGIPVEVRAL